MLAQVALHRFPARKQQDFIKLIDINVTFNKLDIGKILSNYILFMTKFVQ